MRFRISENTNRRRYLLQACIAVVGCKIQPVSQMSENPNLCVWWVGILQNAKRQVLPLKVRHRDCTRYRKSMPMAWRWPLWVPTFYEMRNGDHSPPLRPAEIVYLQLRSRSPCMMLMRTCRQSTVAVAMLTTLPWQTLYCSPSPTDSFNFVFYNDSSGRRFVYILDIFARFCPQLLLFWLTGTPLILGKKTPLKNSWLLVHMLVARGSIQTLQLNIPNLNLSVQQHPGV